ncbi:MAG: hypothetical protein A49_03770 [Methyloceanibacter sp.]|nr:MAG: hypothetical protein A49_03770 [Methyloceanibacter sp.]
MARKTQLKNIVAFKGLDKDLKCRDFQFEVGASYKVCGRVGICAHGFHACEAPFDVWSYYGPVGNRFAIVELSGDTDTHSEDTKIAAAEITITAELTLPEFIKRGVDWLIEAAKGGAQNASGDYAQIGASGDYAQIGASGDYAKIGASGDYAKIGASGYNAQIGASGVVASAGIATETKGVNGTWVSLAEFGDDGTCVGFATGCIGRDGLKEDTWYRAQGGKLVEVGA